MLPQYILRFNVSAVDLIMMERADFYNSHIYLYMYSYVKPHRYSGFLLSYLQSQLRVVYPTLCLIALSTTGICQQGLHLSAGYWGILSHSRTRLQCKHRTISVYRVTTHIQQACATDENQTCFVKSHQTLSGRFSLEILYVNIFFWFAGITSRRPFSRGTYF